MIAHCTSATEKKTATSPRGSVPFDEVGAVIVVSDCLPDTVRSQGFSPSQRFDPTEPCDGFHVTSAHRVWVVFRALFRAVSREPSRVALLSCR